MHRTNDTTRSAWRDRARRTFAVIGVGSLAAGFLSALVVSVDLATAPPAAAATVAVPATWSGNVSPACGSYQSTTAPAGATSATVTLDGASGGGGGSETDYPLYSAAGGDGGQLSATLSVTAGTTYSAEIGCGGGGGPVTTDANCTTPTTGGGGASGTGYVSGGAGGAACAANNDSAAGGGGGGGATALCVGTVGCTTLLGVAGGGGGGGGAANSGSGLGVGGAGGSSGSGSASSGASGCDGHASGCPGSDADAKGGTGGTSTAGGAGGSGNGFAGATASSSGSGSSGAPGGSGGGTSDNSSGGAGGGGGGGYYGGGGGGGNHSSNDAGGGGGGGASNAVSGSLTAVTYQVGPSGGPPGGPTDVAGSPGSAGSVTIVWNVSPASATWNGNVSPACGSYQSTTAPAGATSATVTLDGASGGGGGSETDYPLYSAAGGDGGQLSATLSVTAGTTYSAEIGCGGGGGPVTTDANCTTPTTGGGGASGTGYVSGGAGGAACAANNDSAAGGGGGGGATALCVGTVGCTTLLGVAGGGGGGGGAANSGSGLGVGGAGGSSGSGSASSGASGCDGHASGCPGSDADAKGGTGGTSTAGGAGGSGNGFAGATASSSGSGSSGAPGGSGGGTSDNSSGGAGGGGGGGYYGGGGGGGNHSSNDAGGGGGGGASNAVSGSLTAVTYQVGPSGGPPGGPTDVAGSPGSAGSVTIVWNGNAPAAPSPSAATFTTGTDSPDGTAAFTAATAAGTNGYSESGALPSGLSFDATKGSVYGTPAAGTGGTYAISVTAVNSFGTSPTDAVTLTVDQAPSITSASSTTFTAGVVSSFQVSTAAGTYPSASYTDTAFAGCTPSNLPTGVSLSSSGNLTGTTSMTSAGAFTLCVNAANGVGTAATQQFTLTVTPAAPSQLVFSTEPPVSGTAGVALTPATVVSVEDAYGNLESTGHAGSTDQVTLAVASGPDGGAIASGATASASDGEASFSSVTIDVSGTYTLSATDSSESLSVATSTSVDIAAAATSSALTSSLNPAGYHKAVTLTDTVSGNATLGAPTGTVTFADTTGGGDATIAGCGAAELSGASATTSVATCTYTPPATGGTGGTFTVVATYSGDASYATSSSDPFSEQVLGHGHGLLALSFSANPVDYGASVTLNASLTFTSGQGTPSGTIGFFDLTDNQTLCQVPVTSTPASAACDFTPPTNGADGGVFAIEATYSGDADYAFADDHQSLTELGSEPASLSTTSSELKKATVGQPVVLDAEVSGSQGTPTGSVTFSIDGQPAPCSTGSATVNVNPQGTGICKWTPSANGTYAVTYTYSGDTTYAPAGPSDTFDQMVAGAIATRADAPVLTAPASPPGQAGQPITVSDTVSAASGPTPTGTVTFSATISGTTSVAACSPVTLDGTGTASCTFTPFAGPIGGTVSVTAAYNGSATDAPSASSPALTVAVLGSSTLDTFAISSNANPSAANKVVTLTATLSGSAGVPSGTVSFTDNGDPVACNGTPGGAKVTASGTASCQETPGGPGTHTIAASYSGDVDYAPQGAPVTYDQAVDGTTAVNSVVVTSAESPNAYDTSVTLTATVSANSGTPSGTVDFSAKVNGTTTLVCADAPLSGSGSTATATCNYDPAVSGGVGQSASVTASYSGDATYAAKGSSPLTQVEDGTAALSTFTLASNANPSGQNKVVTLTATLAGSGATPTGTVTFFDGGTAICTEAKVAASGVATCRVKLTTAGEHDISAAYSGDPTYAAANDPSDLDQQVS